MAEYLYKGFKVHYDVKPLKSGQEMYEARASVSSVLENNDSKLTQKFQTASSTKNSAQCDIKKIIHNYIDFEWKEFLEMQNTSKRPD